MCLYCAGKCHYHFSLLVRFLFNLLQKHFMIIVSIILFNFNGGDFLFDFLNP